MGWAWAVHRRGFGDSAAATVVALRKRRAGRWLRGEHGADVPEVRARPGCRR